jgi:hypothetical protein
MSRVQLAFLIPSIIGGTIGTIHTIDNEVKTLKSHKFTRAPDIFKIGARVSVGFAQGALCGIMWPIYGSAIAYKFTV